MDHANPIQYTQKWTLKKIVCYLLYLSFAKYLPIRLGPIGRLSGKLRRLLCRPLFHLTEGTFNIGRGVDFDNGSNIILRDHANIGSYASLGGGGRATITIGRHVMMGKECIFVSQNHKYNADAGYDGYSAEDILVDDYAWLGHRVIILSGVTIGKHAIIGAGAVVAKDIPPFTVAVGNPAKVVKYRKNKPE
ncbi:MAG: acyltransferase [Syntrophaceae bacterium]|nr:acyltransferase [Syntrophaceae bacterium]